ncbi:MULTISPECIES: LysR family transcriptional regulator [Pseudomonas]|uniref:LysR family transcriptional regulator n=1 Tax=Pseudomonas quercus TaxID=2722792 RepID=A0ABX0YKC7_9PSED|nr:MULTISPECIES: LysR family transcriptional regulator [Pseudomonas]MBF7143223.1 LysR family transcriptional regulator [Pseudomonas sp. LY10J]NJP03400.1 LysR family transcriptional regulator [Pseudomonas quercus]
MDVLLAMSVYVRVVEEGSMTAAAQACGLSTTMVGNHIRALEQRLGVSLLQRTTRRQRLTEFGTQYYQRCVEVLGLVDAAEQLAEQAQAEPAGRLRITAPLTFGVERLSPALAEYHRHYPKVRLDVVLSNQRLDLLDNGFDIAIRLGNPDPANGVIARRLEDYTLTICAAPAYLHAHGIPQAPMDLCAHNCLAFDYPAGDDWQWVEKQWRLEGAEGEVLVPVSGSIIMNSSSGLHQAALAGMGIVMMPDPLVADDLANGRLVPLLQAYRLPRRPMNLMYASDRYRLPKIRTFVDFALDRWARPA